MGKIIKRSLPFKLLSMTICDCIVDVVRFGRHFFSAEDDYFTGPRKMLSARGPRSLRSRPHARSQSGLRTVRITAWPLHLPTYLQKGCFVNSSMASHFQNMTYRAKNAKKFDMFF